MEFDKDGKRISVVASTPKKATKPKIVKSAKPSEEGKQINKMLPNGKSTRGQAVVGILTAFGKGDFTAEDFAKVSKEITTKLGLAEPVMLKRLYRYGFAFQENEKWHVTQQGHAYALENSVEEKVK